MAKEIVVAGVTIVIPDTERWQHYHKDDVLPPKNPEDLLGYFVRRDFNGHPENGYGDVAGRIIQVIEQLVSDDDGTAQGPQKANLMLAPGQYSLTDEIPEASRALIEMTYALVGGETTGEINTKAGRHVFINAAYGGKSLEFVETYTEVDGYPTMEWGVRTNDPPELAEEDTLQELPERASPEERLNLYQITIQEIQDWPVYEEAA